MKKKECSSCKEHIKMGMAYKNMWLMLERLHDETVYAPFYKNTIEDLNNELDQLKRSYNFICDRLTEIELKKE